MKVDKVVCFVFFNVNDIIDENSKDNHDLKYATGPGQWSRALMKKGHLG